MSHPGYDRSASPWPLSGRLRALLALAFTLPVVLHGGPTPLSAGAPQEREPRAIPPLRLAAVPRAAAGAEPDTVTAQLVMRISDDPTTAGPGAPAAVAVPLPPERLRELLERLPASGDGAGGTADDRGNAPADRSAGDPARPPASAEPLRVVSVGPMGETELAPTVTVVFSRPMVALGADGEPIAGAAPVRLEPQPPGAWRWLDVRTLRFEPDAGRLPGATAYTVRVPVDVRSHDGARMEEPLETRFRTAGVRVLGGYPHGGPTDLSPTILITFDHPVDPAAVLAAARLEAAGAMHALRGVSLAELDTLHQAMAATARQTPEGTWAALRPVRPLPAGAEAVFQLGAELTSLEGPLPAGRAQEMRFDVRGTFELLPGACEDPEEPCRPHGLLELSFTNPLAAEQPFDDLVRIEPAIEGLGFAERGRMLRLTGEFRPHTRYRVRIDRGIRDRFGQRLGARAEREVHFGTPHPFVRIPGDGFVHLDPEANGRIDLAARSVGGVVAEVHRVGPGEWADVQDSLSHARFLGRTWRPAGPPDRRWTVPGGSAAREFARLPVDLSDDLAEGGNHLLLIVEGLPPAGEEHLPPWSQDRAPRDVAWVQATSYAVGASWDGGTVVAWAASLADGAPVEGVEVELPDAGARAVTDAAGLARLPLGMPVEGAARARFSVRPEGDPFLLARHAGEVALLPASVARRHQGSWTGDPGFPAPLWSVVSDRGLYRPGEELVVHGWIRGLTGEPRRDLVLPERIDSVRYQVHPARGPGIAEGALPVSRTGTFHLRVSLPAEVRSGRARVSFAAVRPGGSAPGWTADTWFGVEEFRRPDYDVVTEIDAGPHLPGDTVRARVAARYFDGGPMPNADVTWRATVATASWAPPGWGGWRFGAWSSRRGARRLDSPPTHAARTDGEGGHRLLVVPERLEEPYPTSLALQVQVGDVNRQAASSSTATIVHPAALTAGVRTDRHWIRAGEALAFDVVAVDLEGRSHAEAVPDVRVARLGEATWFHAPSTDEEPTPVGVECEPAAEQEEVGGSAVRPLRCRFVADRRGRYAVDVDVIDTAGRRSRTSLDMIALDGAVGHFVGTSRVGAAAELRPDRAAYVPGDTARVLLTTPWPSARGLLTTVRYGIREARSLRFQGPSEELRIPIAEDDVGGIDLVAAVTPGSGATDELRAYVRLVVDAAPRRLAVEVRPEAVRVDAGAEVGIDLEVTRADGSPAAGGEVALWLVDEAVLALAGYRLADPLKLLLRPDAAGGAGIFLPHRTVLWTPRPLGPGTVTAEVLDVAWGDPAQGVQAVLEGTDARARIQDGRLVLRDVAAGTYRLAIARGEEPLFVREITVPAEGLHLGTLLLGAAQDAAARSDRSVPPAALLESVVEEARFAEHGGIQLRATPDRAPPVTLREIFRALAAFEPAVRLDVRGRASVPIRLPDTVTRYRIFAVATDGARRFGTAEGSVTAARDLVVRASPPRTLHPGDRPELPIVVQNTSDGPLSVDVVARTSGGLPLEGEAGFRLRLEPGARHELRFPARADRIGTPALDVLAVGSSISGSPASRDGRDAEEGASSSGELVDAVRVSIPVRPLLAPRDVAIYQRLTVAEPIRLALETPARAEPGYGSLDVTLSTSLLAPLVDVIRGLCLRPWLWPEPTIARVLGLSALDAQLDVLSGPGLPEPDAIRALVRDDVERLVEWLEPYRYGLRPGTLPGRADMLPYPLARVHAIHALHEAAHAGYEVQEHELAGYASEVMRTWHEERGRLAALGRAIAGWEHAVGAYALHVATRIGAELVEDEVTAWLAGLEPADLPVEVLAWSLGPAAAAPERAGVYQALLAELENRALTTAATATFRQGGRTTIASADGALERLVLASSRRSDAAALAALLEVGPEHRLVDGLARVLLGHRDGTRAGGAHENGWVLFALGRYGAAAAAGTSDLTARVRVEGASLADERFTGREPRTVHVTRQPPPPGNGVTLEIDADGTGTLQVRAGIRYAPTATPDLPTDERGFLVSRRYESVDDERDVRRDADGTWRVRAGARVRVRVAFTAPARRFQVQLADPLPGGLEPLNATLRGTGFTYDPGPRAARGSIPLSMVSGPLAGAWPPDPYTWDWSDAAFRIRAWWTGWATHQELRDDRVEAYTPYLATGTYETTYLARATTPGVFLAGPVRVEETEHPETFGQGAVDRVVVVVPGG